MKNETLKHYVELVESALEGSRTAQGKIKDEIIRFQEANTTSDFPEAFRVITERAFLAEYADYPTIKEQFTRSYPVNSLKPTSFYSLAFDYDNQPDEVGGKAVVPGTLPRVPELTEYSGFNYVESGQSFGINKYGARLRFSFEALLEDDWGVLESLPQQFGQLAAETQDVVATETFVGAEGPLLASDRHVTGDPALSLEAVQDAVQQITQRTVNGRPVQVPTLTLVVPPALALEAQRITGISSYELTDGDKTFQVGNPIAGLNVTVNKYLPILDQSANANTTWYLMPLSGAGVKPSIVFSPLRGREQPEIRLSNNTGTYLGGGVVPGREGSFLEDAVEFRVRQYFGAAKIDESVMAVSTGTGA